MPISFHSWDGRDRGGLKTPLVCPNSAGTQDGTCPSRPLPDGEQMAGHPFGTVPRDKSENLSQAPPEAVSVSERVQVASCACVVPFGIPPLTSEQAGSYLWRDMSQVVPFCPGLPLSRTVVSPCEIGDARPRFMRPAPLVVTPVVTVAHPSGPSARPLPSGEGHGFRTITLYPPLEPQNRHTPTAVLVGTEVTGGATGTQDARGVRTPHFPLGLRSIQGATTITFFAPHRRIPGSRGDRRQVNE